MHSDLGGRAGTRQAPRDGDGSPPVSSPSGCHALPARVSWRAEVIHGAELGRKLGFPTANMAIQKTLPVFPGVYASIFTAAGGAKYRAVSSLGFRPTIMAGGSLLLETHLFDFKGDLYGQTCSVELCFFIRSEQSFESVDELRAQIGRDCLCARSLLDRA